MGDQPDIFSNEEINTPTPPAFSTTPDDLLASIKNEQGEPKYKTVEDAIKALASSQAFIPQLLSEKKTLEEEIVTLREKAKKVDNIDEVLAKLSAKEPDPSAKETPSASGLNEEAVVNLVKKALEDRDNVSKQRTNLQLVQATLAEKFGDKATEAVRKKAQELGTTPEKLGQLSVENPNLVLALFNAEKVKPAQPSTSSVNLHTKAAPVPLERPSKSLLLGATSKEQTAYMKQIKQEIYKKHGITE